MIFYIHLTLKYYSLRQILCNFYNDLEMFAANKCYLKLKKYLNF